MNCRTKWYIHPCSYAHPSLSFVFVIPPCGTSHLLPSYRASSACPVVAPYCASGHGLGRSRADAGATSSCPAAGLVVASARCAVRRK